MQNKLEFFKFRVFLFFGRIFETPALSIFNKIVVFFNIRILIPILRAQLGSQEIFPRRSSKTPNEYNIFFSDFDLGVVLDNNEDFEPRIKELKATYAKIKFLGLKHLGELEIYTKTEITELRSVHEKSLLIYNFLRDIRKIGWMETAYLNSKSTYHKAKALRAIQKSLVRLNSKSIAKNIDNLSDLEDILKSFFFPHWSEELAICRNLSRGLNITMKCNYLGRFFTNDKEKICNSSAAPSALQLEGEWITFLFAICPPHTRDDAALDAISQKIRSLPKVAFIYADLSQIELHTFNAVLRGEAKNEPWEAGYLKLMEQAVQKSKLTNIHRP